MVHLVVHLHCIFHLKLPNIIPLIAFLHYLSYSLQMCPNIFIFFFCLHFQKGSMEDSVEIVIEKLLHVAKDIVPKVTSIC